VKSLELFAGAGGLALGTARAGFEHVAVIDWDEDAIRTLDRNKADRVEYVRDWEIIKTDVHTYDFLRHQGKVSFVCGGPPCQPFSLGGKHRGHADARNLFPEAVRAIREIQPVAFMFENVKGLLRRGFSDYYHYVIDQLRYPEIVRGKNEEWQDHSARLRKLHRGEKEEGLCYRVEFKLLNAADYGVPQRRERVFIVGVRSDLGISFCFPKATHSAEALLLHKWVTGEYWDRHGISKKARPETPAAVRPRLQRIAGLWRDGFGFPWATVRDAISDLPNPLESSSGSRFADHLYIPGARSYAGHTGSDMDEPAKTLKAGDHGVPGGENTLRISRNRVRYFSVRECARLQTFPDNWALEGSWTEIMRQLGNAVPVSLGEAVSLHLAKTLVLGTAAA
jgi:DNA (cytosine-5)-methyltransferase 1